MINIYLQSELKANNRIPYANGEAMIRPSGEKETSLIKPLPWFDSCR